MDHDDDGETSYNTFVDDVAFEPTYSQALLTAAGRNVATILQDVSWTSISHAYREELQIFHFIMCRLQPMLTNCLLAIECSLYSVANLHTFHTSKPRKV